LFLSCRLFSLLRQGTIMDIVISVWLFVPSVPPPSWQIFIQLRMDAMWPEDILFTLASVIPTWQPWGHLKGNGTKTNQCKVFKNWRAGITQSV
jgi:hypothetical protein